MCACTNLQACQLKKKKHLDINEEKGPTTPKIQKFVKASISVQS